ncbi:MAG: hypothetical protein MJE68_15815, partial [Proteobacteria bacterium]|nr:hypothetical protein [Pseudomonadota bacterium]
FFFIYLLELKPYEIGKDIEKELKSRTKKIRAKADANLLIKITISLLFHILIFAADSMAFVEYGKLSDEIHDYYYAAPRYFWSVPILMIIFDGLSFLIIYTLVPIIAHLTKKWYRLTYCVLSPIACVLSHCYHIIFAFIDNPYHATIILLLYAIVLFVLVLGFQQVHYFINHFWERENKNPDSTDEAGLEVRQENDNPGPEEIIIIDRQRICKNCVTFICFIGLFIVTGVSIGLSLALLTLLPITNAIDDAPNRLYVIYQASVTFFAALIAFQVIFRHNNSPFAFLIKAQEMCDNKELKNICSDKKWKEKSEKEREIYLVRKVILAIEKLASDGTKQDHGDGNPPKSEKKPKGTPKPSQEKVAADGHSKGGTEEKDPLIEPT